MAAELPPLAQPLTDTPETSFTLSSAYYTDPGVFELEKEKIFYRSWQYIAPRQSFASPGDYVVVEICEIGSISRMAQGTIFFVGPGVIWANNRTGHITLTL